MIPRYSMLRITAMDKTAVLGSAPSVVAEIELHKGLSAWELIWENRVNFSFRSLWSNDAK
jgi:hypothetical protein